MNEADNAGNIEGPAEDLTSDRDPEQRLRERLAEVVRVLALADEAGRVAGPAAFRLLEEYRAPFAEALTGFGEALADFLPLDSTYPTLFEHPAFSEQLRPLSDGLRSFPLFRRIQALIGNHQNDEEVERTVLLRGQPGFDLPGRLVQDFYRNTVTVRSFQSRAAALAERTRVEIRTRALSEGGPVRMLRLVCGSGVEPEAVMVDRVCAENLMVTCVDNSLVSLRRAGRVLERRFTHKPRLLRADPLTLNSNPNRPRELFDIVYTLTLFVTLTASEALTLARSCYGFLAPGGVLLTGSYAPDLPRSERALLAGLLGLQIEYRDEGDWLQLLRAARFDPDSTRLERPAPSTILVGARRGAPVQSQE